jgi:AhpD family alkylhydroperoxidase
MSLLFQTEFDARKREIAILRVAHVTRSRYEWHQHVTIARRVGVTDEEIAKIAVDGPVRGLDEEGNLLCRVADEISRDVRLSDEALSAILERYGRRQAVELILVCGHFNMVSRILESTRVEVRRTSCQVERCRLVSIRNLFRDLNAAGSRLACPPRASFSKPSMPQKTASR